MRDEWWPTATAGQGDHRLRREADDGWAEPILVGPHVSGSCTRVEEPTGDKTGGLGRRQGGMDGVPLGDKSSCLMFYWDVKNLVSLGGLAFKLYYVIRRFLGGAF